MVNPDLTIMGKVIGGGLPAAAYGGRRELLERIAPAGEVYQAGTLSGNPLAVAAGWRRWSCSTSRRTRGSATTTELLAAGMREAAGDRPVQVAGVPGLLTVFFSEDPVARLCRPPPRATSKRTRGGAGRCSRAACTRRRRSSRHGSRRLRTPSTTSSRRSKPPRRRSPRSNERRAAGPAARTACRGGARGRRADRRRGFGSTAGRSRVSRARRGARARAPRPLAASTRCCRADPRGLAAALRRTARAGHRRRRPRAPGRRPALRAGLARLAALGDLEAVAELGDVISLSAQAHAACDPDLADAVWSAGAAVVGTGAARTTRPRRPLARTGDAGAAAALRAAAARRAPSGS